MFEGLERAMSARIMWRDSCLFYFLEPLKRIVWYVILLAMLDQVLHEGGEDGFKLCSSCARCGVIA